jgi:hypothetical protein
MGCQGVEEGCWEGRGVFGGDESGLWSSGGDGEANWMGGECCWDVEGFLRGLERDVCVFDLICGYDYRC